MYQTQSGTILASGRYRGTGVMAVSNPLFMHLNYDKAEMHLRLVIPTIITENDSLNMLLQKAGWAGIDFLCFLFADWYCNWCLKQMLSDAKKTLNTMKSSSQFIKSDENEIN